jgi:hypothetical protein
MNTLPRPSEVLVTKFLRDALTADALGVPKLEAMARAAGLLGEGQEYDPFGMASGQAVDGFGDCRPVLMYGRQFWQPDRSVQHPQSQPFRASGSKALPG